MYPRQVQQLTEYQPSLVREISAFETPPLPLTPLTQAQTQPLQTIDPGDYQQNYQPVNLGYQIFDPAKRMETAEEAARRVRQLDLETYREVLPEYRRNLQMASLLRAIPQILIERSQSRTAENVARMNQEVGLANSLNTMGYWR